MLSTEDSNDKCAVYKSSAVHRRATLATEKWQKYLSSLIKVFLVLKVISEIVRKSVIVPFVHGYHELS